MSEATICQILRKNGLTRKKIRVVATQRSMEYKARYMATVLSFLRQMFVFIDKTGSADRNYIRTFGCGLHAESQGYLSS